MSFAYCVDERSICHKFHEKLFALFAKASVLVCRIESINVNQPGLAYSNFEYLENLTACLEFLFTHSIVYLFLFISYS